ncbi:hypothetical protein [Streptomyces sp. NPDC003952]
MELNRGAEREGADTGHKQIRARIENCIARMKTYRILRDCRLRGEGVRYATLGTARLHNLNIAGQHAP